MLYKAQEVVVQSVVKTSVFEFLTSTVERNITARGEERRKCSGNKGLKRITKKGKSAKETKRGSSALLSLGEADRSWQYLLSFVFFQHSWTNEIFRLNGNLKI